MESLCECRLDLWIQQGLGDLDIGIDAQRLLELLHAVVALPEPGHVDRPKVHMRACSRRVLASC